MIIIKQEHIQKNFLKWNVLCDDQRELTDEERINFGIGTKESYFETLKNQ